MKLLAFLRRRSGDGWMRQLVRDREELARLARGGSPDHPIVVGSAAVVEVRVGRLACPQCGGTYRLLDHAARAPGLREVRVVCAHCRVRRALWFRLGSDEAN